MATPVNNDQFKNALKSLNKAQRSAVEATEGAVMVIAGPGTGKTQILTLRIANILVKTDINPDNILALTFTESGAYAMRKRLVEMIGTPGYRVDITTFHGFCNDLMRNNPDDFPDFIASDSVDELEQIQIIEKIIDSEKLIFLKPFGDPYYYVKPALSAISELKKEGVTVEKFEEAINREEADFNTIEDLYHEKGPYKGRMKSEYDKKLKHINKNKELLIIYTNYQKELATQRAYDFNDMLIEVIKAFQKNKQLLLRMQERYQYILVDEHQDTNAAQNKIIELMCNFHKNPNLFMVGDEKQSIYRFQGASLENFLYFRELYPEALLINLEENYRSTQTILDASGKLIKNNLLSGQFMPENAQLIAKSRHPEHPIKIIAASDYYAEHYYVAEVIKEKIASGVAARDIAILAKENKDIFSLIDALEQQSIPYVVESSLSILQDLEIQKLITLFNAVFQFGDEAALVKAMHVDALGISPVDVLRLVTLARKKNTSVWDMLSSGEYKTEQSLVTKKQIEQFYFNLVEWAKKVDNERFDHLFKSVLNDSGFMKMLLTRKHFVQNLDKVVEFYEHIKQRIEKNPSFHLRDFMEYLELLKKHQVTIKQKVKTTHKNAVRLMTAHKSKGLEFDVVFIIHVYNGHWGNGRKRSSLFALPWNYLQEKITTLTDEEKNEDERRLFYVALTRARREVFVSYSTRALEGSEQVPSQFIEEILPSYKEAVNIDKFENDFLNNKQMILSLAPQTTEADIVNEYLANKDLFAELFMQKGLSATSLNNYLECPWRYFFRNLLGLPDSKDKRAMFGTAIHQALNTYLLNGGKSLSLEFLLNSYDKALQQQPLTPEEIEELQTKGQQVLKGFYKSRMSLWKNNLKSELTIKGIRFSENVKLTGKIDMIEQIDKSPEVIVYDFKTGKPKSRGVVEGTTKTGTGDYKRQLVFYKILLDRYQYEKMRMVKGIIEFVEPSDKGIYKQEEFIISDEEVRSLELQIAQISDEIMSFAFWDKGCKKKDCEYCRLRSYISN